MPDDPLSISDFAKRIKEKHPDYGEVPDAELVSRVLKKYPDYKSVIARPTEAHLDALTSFAKQNNLRVGSTTGGRHNAGSLHYSGNAVDFSPQGVDFDALREKAFQNGFILRDERTHPKGQKVWGGPHGHLEYVGDAGQPTDAGQSASEPVAPVAAQPMARVPRGARVRPRGPEVGAAVSANLPLGVSSQQAVTRGMGATRDAAQPHMRRPKQLDAAQMRQQGEYAPDLTIAEARRAEERSPEAQTRQQVITEREKQRQMALGRYGGMIGTPQIGIGAIDVLNKAMSPISTLRNLTKSEDELTQEEVDKRMEAQRRSDTPEMIAERKEFGKMSAPRRAVSAPAARFGAGLVKSLAGVTSGLGIAPNQLSEYLNRRGQVLEEATNAPLDEKGEEVKRGIPEKVVSALGDVGFGVAQIIALKKAAPGLSMGQIMAAETALRTSDLPAAERADQIAHAAAMGKVLEGHLGRTESAALFGVPTAIQSGSELAKGRGTVEDALINTAVQAGTGFALGGKPGETVPEHHSKLQPRNEVGQFDGPPAKPAERPVTLPAEAALREQPTASQPRALTREQQQVQTLRGERRTLKREAETDDLTGLGNQRAWNKALPKAEADPNTIVLTGDINNMKALNDTQGKKAGDALIQKAADAFKQAAGEAGENRVFRSGIGDEISAVVPKEKAEGIRRRAEEIFGEQSVGDKRVSFSVGAGENFKAAEADLTPRKQAAKSARREVITPSAQEGVASVGDTTPSTKGQSRLAQGVQAKAVAAKLTEGFEGLPEYEKVNVADQAQKASDLLKTDPEKAHRIAMGQEVPEGDLLPESVFVAVENHALKNGDVETLRNLATTGTLSSQATGMGQRIRMLAERDPHSAVSAMRQVQEARQAKAERKFGKRGVQKIKTEITVELKKAAPKVRDWASFVDSIKC